MFRRIAVWLVVLAQPLQACCGGICVPAPNPKKGQRGCCQVPTKAADPGQPAEGSDSLVEKRPSCCRPLSKEKSARSCCKPAGEPRKPSTRMATGKCGKRCSPTSGCAPAIPAARHASTAHRDPDGGLNCRARHESCCCCWPMPKDIPAPTGPKLPKTTLNVHLSSLAGVHAASDSFAGAAPDLEASLWRSHSERQSSLCAWLK
jgi:hypothetical protein